MLLIKSQVKGQISDMALCISDPLDKISGLAKHFFSELSRKGNALYNVMPDIISRYVERALSFAICSEKCQI